MTIHLFDSECDYNVYILSSVLCSDVLYIEHELLWTAWFALSVVSFRERDTALKGIMMIDSKRYLLISMTAE